jgi:hypothetical protein
LQHYQNGVYYSETAIKQKPLLDDEEHDDLGDLLEPRDDESANSDKFRVANDQDMPEHTFLRSQDSQDELYYAQIVMHKKPLLDDKEHSPMHPARIDDKDVDEFQGHSEQYAPVHSYLQGQDSQDSQDSKYYEYFAEVLDKKRMVRRVKKMTCITRIVGKWHAPQSEPYISMAFDGK